MSIDNVKIIGDFQGPEEIARRPSPGAGAEGAFADTLREAVSGVDELQRESRLAQAAFASGSEIDLHEVMIKIEEAEIAFRAMMEVRTKLIDAYREVMRIGAGG